MSSYFGVPFDLVNGIIAGGDIAIRKAVENGGQCLSGLEDLQEHKISANDVVVGIAASGTTPYIGGLEACNKIILLQEVFPVMQATHSLKLHSFYRRSSGSRVCNGQFQNESWNRTKISVKHDFDPTMIQLGKVKQNGRHATK
jgi:N-acetylmuramic acid 6-phosphate etherase